MDSAIQYELRAIKAVFITFCRVWIVMVSGLFLAAHVPLNLRYAAVGVSLLTTVIVFLLDLSFWISVDSNHKRGLRNKEKSTH